MNIVFNDTTVTLDPKKDTAILLDLQYLQRLSALLRQTNKLILGGLVGQIRLRSKFVLLNLQRDFCGGAYSRRWPP